MQIITWIITAPYFLANGPMGKRGNCSMAALTQFVLSRELFLLASVVVEMLLGIDRTCISEEFSTILSLGGRVELTTD